MGKMCGQSDSLKLRWQNDADLVSFQCESGEDDRIADFDLKLMQIESEHMEVPEQHYKVVAKLPSAEFQKICRDLKEFGETMQLKATKEGITFSVQGDMGSGNVMLKPREAEKPEDKVSVTVHEPAAAGRAAEEGGGRHEGPLQGRQLRLLGEGSPGAVHGQLARGPSLTASAGVRVLRLQVRQTDLAWHERGL